MTTKDRSTLLADLLVSYPNNAAGLITPTILRSQQTDIIESFLNFLSDIPDTIQITSEQDWIDNTTDSGGNDRTMILDKTYVVVGAVTHAFTLKANGINRITANAVLTVSNNYTGVNAHAYEVDNAAFGLVFDNITINCPGKDWILSTASIFLSTDRCSIQALGLGTCNALVGFFAFTRYGNTGAEFTTGMVFTTTGNVSMDVTNCAYFPNQATASLPCLDLNSSTWGDMRVESTKFNLGGTNFAITGLSSAGNLINAGFVNHCDMTGSANALDGVSEHDDPWIFTGNLGTAESGASIGAFVEGNTTATVIGVGAGDDGNPILVNVGVLAASYIDERFSISTAGVLTYEGANPALKSVTFTGHADTASGNNVPYTFYVAVGGVVVNGSRGVVSLDSADPGVFITQALVGLASGSEISLFVEENSGTTNITISDFSVVVN